jgi:hypothetical protein
MLAPHRRRPYAGEPMPIVCCFCGEALEWAHGLRLAIHVSEEGEGTQSLFCHRRRFRERLRPGFPLHPDLESDG